MEFTQVILEKLEKEKEKGNTLEDVIQKLKEGVKNDN